MTEDLIAADVRTGPAADPIDAARLPRRRRVRRLLVGVVAAAVAVAAPIAWVQMSGQSRLRASAAVRDRGVALVLGAGLRPDGSPSTYLRRRLNAAIEIYQRGDVHAILVSGDRQDDSYDEPAAMRAWLRAHGVPDAAIVRDSHGFDTHDSCVRAREVFGVRRAVVVTQDYHARRAAFSCARAGIDAVGVGVPAHTEEPWRHGYFQLRELPASLRAAWDAATSRRPVGPMTPDDAVVRILSAT